MQKKQDYTISVPVYAYAKKILQKHFGDTLSKNHLQYDFFIAVGNLSAPIFQVSKTKNANIPISSNNITPIDMLEVQTKIPGYTIHLLSLYRKEDIAHSLATILNKQAKEILRAVVEFNFKNYPTKTKACQEIFKYFQIEEDELSLRNYLDDFYKTKYRENSKISKT
ncbi:hypothetical protein V9L05_15210 [Bernardetia sp. Wsw4-3y2]|uniref:hypothetical protein n=1 Tax=Bernardetia sp. Wsw4-3y2 TaxID=3127471 RepID=UPI0030CE00CB